MKKIIIGIVVSIIICCIVFSIYYINVTKKLVCTRYGAFDSSKGETDNITFKFNIKGKVKEGIAEQIYEYDSTEEAKRFYKNLNLPKMYKIKLDDTKVIIIHDEMKLLDNPDYDRETIIKKYGEYGYECK